MEKPAILGLAALTIVLALGGIGVFFYGALKSNTSIIIVGFIMTLISAIIGFIMRKKGLAPTKI